MQVIFIGKECVPASSFGFLLREDLGVLVGGGVGTASSSSSSSECSGVFSSPLSSCSRALVKTDCSTIESSNI